MKIVFIGLPGSGKGTQASLLSKETGIQKITAGDLLREVAKENSERGKIVKEFLDQGKIVPDEITNQLIKERIEGKKDYILDGYPRDMVQTKFLEAVNPPDKVVFLNVSTEEIVRRLSSRRVCPKCNAVYNLISNPPKKDEICDVCSSKLIQRDDDKPELIRKRIEVQSKELGEILNFYKKQGKLLTVDGNKKIEEVFEEIKRRLK